MSKQNQDVVAWVNRNDWLDGVDIRTELRQAREEGRDLSSLEGEFDRLLIVPSVDTWHQRLGGGRDLTWWRDAGKLVDAVQALPYRKDFAYVEPSDLPGIRASCPEATTLTTFAGSRDDFLERLHGGLLARICGCMLGKPVESWHRRDIRITADETGNWPLADYFTLPNPAQQKKIDAHRPKPRQFDFGKCAPVTLPAMNGMVEDDDINYTTTGFAILKQYGKDFTPMDVACFWGTNIAIFSTCTAERVAYRNFVNFVLPPESASYRNPYREWIGAQIRADYYGYANPGNPARAAEWAWRDASISHVKNGIYGAMWVAAMLAAAYVEQDVRAVIRAGLAQVPARSRFADDVTKILTAHAKGASYDDAIDRIHAQWDEANQHDWCHTNSNAQVVTAALLYGTGDFEKTITGAVSAGFDTDCNGATAGSVWGILHGSKQIPQKWTKPLQDRVRTAVNGYHDVKISQLARDMVDVALAFED